MMTVMMMTIMMTTTMMTTIKIFLGATEQQEFDKF
jgi:hypothetical protein